MPDPVTKHNQKFWEKPEVFTDYIGVKNFFAPEAFLFLKYSGEIVGKRILDLGCGAGRTTQVLRQLASQYVGVDSSEEMIHLCRTQYPDTDFLVSPSADLSHFRDASFDAVFFSSNGIDCMGQEDRLRSFGEIRRVLKSGGLFIFSSHNQRSERAGAPPRLRFARNPVTFLHNFFGFLRCHYRHLKNKPKEVHTETYSVLNDSAHDFLFLIYYIAPAQQRAQAQEAGFDILETVDLSGKPLKMDEDAKDSPWIHYAVRKR